MPPRARGKVPVTPVVLKSTAPNSKAVLPALRLRYCNPAEAVRPVMAEPFPCRIPVCAVTSVPPGTVTQESPPDPSFLRNVLTAAAVLGHV